MQLSWKNFLRCHPSVADYNKGTKELQALFETGGGVVGFRNLAENRTIVCLTRSPSSNETQATFMHASEKETFQQQTPYSLALMGFGRRAHAVRLNPALIFSRSNQKQKVPDFDSFMNCSSKESLVNIDVGASEEKICNFAILPPLLSEELFDVDSLEAIDVLWSFIKKIKGQRNSVKDDDSETDDPEHIGNASPCSDGNDDDSPSEEILADEKASFHKILLFLWAVMKDHKSVPGTPVTVCNKKFTKDWEDQLHRAHIKSTSPVKSNVSTNQNQQRGYTELTDQLEELNNNLTARKLDTTRDKDEEDSSGLKRFKKLSKVHQNIIRMFTITEFHCEEDIDDLEPAHGMLEMLACQGVYDAQGLIHNMLKRNGNMAFIQTGI